MAGTVITLNTVAGAKVVGDPSLFGLHRGKILKVKRSGTGYDIVYSSVSLGTDERKVWYKGTDDKLRFNVPFNSGEKIYVLLK